MTMATDILALADGKRTTRQIAERVYAERPISDKQMAYVRVVIRQRRGTKPSQADSKYSKSRLGQITYAGICAYVTSINATGNKKMAKLAQRTAYQAARKAGKSAEEANRVASRERSRVLYQTANKKAAKMARAAARSAKGRSKSCRLKSD